MRLCRKCMYDGQILGLARAVEELVMPAASESIEEVLALKAPPQRQTLRSPAPHHASRRLTGSRLASAGAGLAGHGRLSRKKAHRDGVIASQLAS